MRFSLVHTAEHLELQDQEHPEYKPLFIDFNQGKAKHRRIQPGSELLIKALGKNKDKTSRTIIDATAGLGRDAFVLACAGYNVLLIERSPIIASLLTDALQRAQQQPELTEIISRMQLITADANEILTTHSADIIYVDPMFPERKKSAAVKKEMRILHDLLIADLSAQNLLDDEKLLTTALTAARERVIVKRPLYAPPLNNLTPNLTYKGKSSRFDVYIV